MTSLSARGGPVATLCLVQFVDVLGVTSATTAIPAMLTGVGAPPAATGALAAVYAMFFGGLLILGARLGDKYGHRRVLLLGLGLFVTVALVGGTAQEAIQLFAARALQGAAAAVSVPCALRLLLEATAAQPATRRKALAAWSASGAAAGALGYLVGGALTETLTWRSVFWVNAPVGLLLVVGVLVLVPFLPPENRHEHLDLAGAALLIAAVMALIVGGSQVESPGSRGTGAVLLATGLGIGAAFARQQRRAASPLIPRSAFSSPHLRAGTVASFVNTATTSSAGVLATLVLQQELGASPVRAGLILMPFSLAVIAGAGLSQPVSRVLSIRRAAATGLAGIAAGNLVLALTYGSVAGVILGVTVAGLGLGVSSVAATALGTDVDASLTGSASGVLNTGAQLGTALGVAALVSVAAVAGRQGPATAWAAAAALAALTAVTLAMLPDQALPDQALPGSALPDPAVRERRSG